MAAQAHATLNQGGAVSGKEHDLIGSHFGHARRSVWVAEKTLRKL
ncbi:MAG: hypothetical protein PV362_10115 [Providencia heimbachae]|nr:hypothetical protein [Providencia heimbachae]